jgi:hypothetical protein
MQELEFEHVQDLRGCKEESLEFERYRVDGRGVRVENPVKTSSPETSSFLAASSTFLSAQIFDGKGGHFRCQIEILYSLLLFRSRPSMNKNNAKR